MNSQTTSKRILLDPETDYTKQKESISQLFKPVQDTIESLDVIGWSVVVNYNLRGYEHFETTYPEAWVTEYVNGHYHATDPVFIWSLARQGMRRWSETGLPDIFRVMHKAKKLGLNFGGIWSQKTGKKRTVIFAAKRDREFYEDEMEKVNDATRPFFEAMSPTDVLTDGEYDVLELLVEGLSVTDIANQLNVSNSAVKARLSSARNKMDCTSTAQLIYRIVNDGILR